MAYDPNISSDAQGNMTVAGAATAQRTLTSDNGQVSTDGAGTVIAQNLELTGGVAIISHLRGAANNGFADATLDADPATAIILPLTSPDTPSFNGYVFDRPVVDNPALVQTVRLYLKAGASLTAQQQAETQLFVNIIGRNLDGTPSTSGRIICGSALSPISLHTDRYRSVDFPCVRIVDPAAYPHGYFVVLSVTVASDPLPAAAAAFVLSGGAGQGATTPYVSVDNGLTFQTGPATTMALVLQELDTFSVEADAVNYYRGIGVFGQPAPTVQPTGGVATAGNTYTATEKQMLQAIYDAARGMGIIS